MRFQNQVNLCTRKGHKLYLIFMHGFIPDAYHAFLFKTFLFYQKYSEQNSHNVWSFHSRIVKFNKVHAPFVNAVLILSYLLYNRNISTVYICRKAYSGHYKLDISTSIVLNYLLSWLHLTPGHYVKFSKVKFITFLISTFHVYLFKL